MRLTTFTDYTLRVLIYLALNPDRFVTITEIAGAYNISANHLMKVTQHLAAGGDIITLRGPRGGLRLARAAEAIRIGDIVRRAEPVTAPLPWGGRMIQSECVLPAVLDRAMAAFMAVLDACSLADLVAADAGDFSAPHQAGASTVDGEKGPD
jgi:Rrf2 family nitric oxide-sensitive transcriptional repressor